MSDPRLQEVRELAAAARNQTIMIIAGLVVALGIIVLIVLGYNALRSQPNNAGSGEAVTATLRQGAPDAQSSSRNSGADQDADAPDVPPTNTWILVLESKEKSKYSLSSVRSEAASIGSPDLLVIDSSITPGLRPNYWAIVYGSFESKSEAHEACGQVNRPVGDGCYAREID